MKSLYDQISRQSSKIITRSYSTSFSLGIYLLKPELRSPIYSIYGFVRVADEIVDTFHEYPKQEMLDEFWADTYKAIDRGISTNPVLNSFQEVVNEYQIPRKLIDTFLKSMKMDLQKTEYTKTGYEEYILGSAEVVGLMCLKVFVNGDKKQYEELKPYAMKLGSAFQKINFLRDLKDDFGEMGRIYFPGVSMDRFDQLTKKEIEEDIAKDFEQGLEGIRRLPASSRLGVYVAYVYYVKLFKKIRNLDANRILEERIRIPNGVKMMLLAKSYVRNGLHML